jgi:hypothetical protein
VAVADSEMIRDGEWGIVTAPFAACTSSGKAFGGLTTTVLAHELAASATMMIDNVTLDLTNSTSASAEGGTFARVLPCGLPFLRGLSRSV